MKEGLSAFGLVTLVLTVSAEGASVQVSKTEQWKEGYDKLPLRFEANEGQTDVRVRFLARGSNYRLFLTPTEMVLVLQRPESTRPQKERAAARKAVFSDVLRFVLLGANPHPTLVGRDELPGRSHYFIGADPANWRTNVAQYARVDYEDVYRGVSLTYYGNQRQLEYDFVVAPGGDPRAIRVAIEGAKNVHLDGEGNLVLATLGGDVVEHAPILYQETAGVRNAIPGRYVLRGKREVGFSVGVYDRTRPLVIDPVLSYSTYLGGAGVDVCGGIATDAAGNTYLTGYTTSTNFPTANPLQATNAGGGVGVGYDAFVTKLSTSGSALVYSTYLGGGGDDQGLGIAIDGSGNAYVTGGTVSTNFPTASPLQAANGGDTDAFVAKLNASGSALMYSTYLGGGASDIGAAIAIDGSGSAYVTGHAVSNNFPTANPLQAANAGSADAFLAKLNASGSALVYSTYLGGGNYDDGRGIAVDGSGNAYLTGRTVSSNFPTANPLQATHGGGVDDAFVTKVSASGSALAYSTYLGGSKDDEGQGVVADGTGNPYVTGGTRSFDFPTASPLQAALGGLVDAFVAKLNGSGSALVYSTYLGGGDDDYATGIAVDGPGNAYVTGSTHSLNFPTANPLQAALGGGNDAFVTKLNASGSALVYSTYLGGGGEPEGGAAIALDGSGNAYVGGNTASTNFPTTNPLQATNAGASDVFVARVSPPPPPSGDFNSDGNTDILFRHQISGKNVAWFMDGITRTAGVYTNPDALPDTNWQIVGTNDFGGDNQTDILFRHQISGKNAVWLMNGITRTTGAFTNPAQLPDTNWRIVGTGDFSSPIDGKPDFLLRHATTGKNVVWYMNGITRTAGVFTNPDALPDTNWLMVGIGDFWSVGGGQDGKVDILWRHNFSGKNVLWYMDGITRTAGTFTNPDTLPDTYWRISAVGDYSKPRDGKPDIVFRHQLSGKNVVWYMDDATRTGGVFTNPDQLPDTSWRIVGPK